MFNLLESDLEKKYPLLIKETAEALRDAKTKIYFWGASAGGEFPKRMCRSGQLEKKIATNRPEVPLPFPLYIEALFSDGDGSAPIKVSPQNFSRGCSSSQLH
jgi:hypothetical protein